MKHNQYVLENDMKTNDVQELVQEECEKWSKKRRNMHYISRDNRNGYKAGALKEAMDLDYAKKCDYVAIFDADHEPPSDFLIRTIPFLIHNPEIGLVQARWKFGKFMNQEQHAFEDAIHVKQSLSWHWRFFSLHSKVNAKMMTDFSAENANECVMTRIQEMSLNYHFKVEQQSGSSTMAFFGFNGEFTLF